VRLGLELLTKQPAAIRLGTFFETWLATPEGTIRRSLGRDEYHLSLWLPPGRRLAATGRTHISQVDLEDAGLGINQARSAQLVPAALEQGVPIVMGLRTNLFLSLAALNQGSRLRLLREGLDPLECELTDPRLYCQEVAAGRYILEISRLLHT